MKKKIVLFSILYYILFLLCYMGALFVGTKLLRTDNLGEAIARTLLLMYVITPALILVLCRFSLLKWYVDPIAAAIVPLFFYGGLVANEMTRGTTFAEAFTQTNNEQGLFLIVIGLFLFGLLASFSPARKNGKSISYKLLNKISSK